MSRGEAVHLDGDGYLLVVKRGDPYVTCPEAREAAHLDARRAEQLVVVERVVAAPQRDHEWLREQQELVDVEEQRRELVRLVDDVGGERTVVTPESFVGGRVGQPPESSRGWWFQHTANLPSLPTLHFTTFHDSTRQYITPHDSTRHYITPHDSTRQYIPLTACPLYLVTLSLELTARRTILPPPTAATAAAAAAAAAWCA